MKDDLANLRRCTKGAVYVEFLIAFLPVFFFFLAMILLFYSSVDEAWHAWQIGELSEQTAWRPILWPFKAIVPVTALLLIVQGVSELLKSIYAARTGQFLTHAETIQV